MLKSLVLIAALVIGSFATAKADPISGNLDTAGSATWFDYGLIEFTPFQSYILNSSTGDFAPWVTAPGSVATIQALNFWGFDSTLSLGQDIFQGVDSNGNPWQISLISLNPTNGWTVGQNGVDDVTIAGYGLFTDAAYTDTEVYFDITTQGPQGPSTANAYSNLVIAPVPEPESLALFGTGLLGIVGIARRKFKA